ncbi:MAG: NAD(+) synthase [Peptoniphilaceae bacterium]|nr:NAD(+) synthase [Peptoniphilaceae bacterium]MDD7383019.1 NAD(+) synthase [Peptoniphilaceae bacterium]MDY3737770.1 NAD(+) synthase [Peptoniphilaceae bacterium]
MKSQYKIWSVNFETKVGDIDKNKNEIENILIDAQKSRVKLVSFPELSLTGSSLGNLFENNYILENSLKAFYELLNFSNKLDLLFTIGFPLKLYGKIYNSIFLIFSGKVLSVSLKKKLKDSEKSIFSEFKEDFSNFDIGEKKYEIDSNEINIGITIGEDELDEIPKSLILKKSNRKFILNPSAEYRFALSNKKKIEDIKYLSKNSIYIYSSQGMGESSTDNLFCGLNVISKNQKIISSSTNKLSQAIIYENKCDFEKGFSFENTYNYEFNISKFPYLPKEEEKEDFCEDIIEIISDGLLTRLKKINTEKVVIGISGGLDSTMSLISINRAYEKSNIDKKNIYCYTLPAFGTSDITKSNANELCNALGLKLNEINITENVRTHLKSIGHDLVTPDKAYENAQARERTQVLMNIANMKNAIVIGTGDLSELALGFATYNGDQMSNYSLNGSLSKTVIRYIINYISENTDNKNLSKVLKKILNTPVSPELKNENSKNITQKTEDIVGPYELIDFFIYYLLEKKNTPQETITLALNAFSNKYDRVTITKWMKEFIKRFFSNQFKRSCMPDGPSALEFGFSPRNGFKIPSDMSYDFFVKDIDN